MAVSKPKNPLSFNYKKTQAQISKPLVHHYCHAGNKFACETDNLGHATPQNRSPLELVVNTPQGFLQLWAPNVTLRWRFQERSLSVFRHPEEAKAYIRDIMAQGIMLWGDSVPVQFTEATDAWDFEISTKSQNNCDANGCTLASAFFPDAGQHELVLYPTLFDQSKSEQIETMAHELGHVFGLRHFFAQLDEKAWPSSIFGVHNKFSIMNYGVESVMTVDDQNDLKTLYRMAWDGSLTAINGTRVNLVQPFSASLTPPCTEAIAAMQKR